MFPLENLWKTENMKNALRQKVIRTGKGGLLVDILMIAALLIGFGLIWLLVKWCEVQIEAQE